MLFSSVTFLFYFLPAVLLGYFLIRGNQWRNLYLLVASLVFFAWGETEMIFLLLFSIYVNYVLAIKMDEQDDQKKRKRYMGWAVAFNIILLGYYKYYGFFVENFSALFGLDVKITGITLPIGISFYTFHNVSYIIDVYKRKIAAQKHLVNLALYIGFFPQLIAGPIVRYVHIADQLYNRVITSALFASGVKRFIIGLGKKVIIANTFALVADKVFAIPSSDLTFSASWIGILAYSIQIYYDFSGYSDMAIGLGRMFGFRFLENFDFPYVSSSIQEFWRRWHISLSSWFRDYLYIPLGGNRVAPWRIYLNLSLVFLCTGFWHGASWNFIVWGALHGLFLIIERSGFGNTLKKLPAFAGHVYTLFVVIIGWVFFRAEDLVQAIRYCKKMLGIEHGNPELVNIYEYLDPYVITMFVFAVFFATPHQQLKTKLAASAAHMRSSVWRVISLQAINIAYILLFVFAIINVASGTYNPFIYFRF